MENMNKTLNGMLKSISDMLSTVNKSTGGSNDSSISQQIQHAQRIAADQGCVQRDDIMRTVSQHRNEVLSWMNSKSAKCGRRLCGINAPHLQQLAMTPS